MLTMEKGAYNTCTISAGRNETRGNKKRVRVMSSAKSLLSNLHARHIFPFGREKPSIYDILLPFSNHS